MPSPVSMFRRSMFLFTTHWAGMEVSNVDQLPCWAFKVLDPDIGMERTLYVRIAMNPEYTESMHPDLVQAKRKEMIEDRSLFAWYCKLGVPAEVAQDAAQRAPFWQIIPDFIPPIGSIQSAKQMVPYKMQFGPLFKLMTYRSMKQRVVNVRSNVLGKVTVGDAVFPWFLTHNPGMTKLVPQETIGWLAVSDREIFGKSLEEGFLKRWPFYARPGMEDLLPKFEVLGKDEYNSTFPGTSIIVDLDGWK